MTFLNDHFLKYYYHNAFTGKLSDFCGLFYFPFFLYALVDFFKQPLKKQRTINITQFVSIIILSDLLFIIFKYSFFKTHLVEFVTKYFFPIQIISDYTDLWAITMNYFSFRIATRYQESTESLKK